MASAENRPASTPASETAPSPRAPQATSPRPQATAPMASAVAGGIRSPSVRRASRAASIGVAAKASMALATSVHMMERQKRTVVEASSPISTTPQRPSATMARGRPGP